MKTVQSRDAFVVAEQDSCAPGQRDGCVVDSAALSGVVSRFVEEWNRGRPPVAGQFAPKKKRKTVDVTSLTAIEWLSQETGISHGTLKNLTSPGGRSQTTELRIADSIVAALGRPEFLHDGTLEVRPNPHARREFREACCGSSLNGSLAER